MACTASTAGLDEVYVQTATAVTMAACTPVYERAQRWYLLVLPER